VPIGQAQHAARTMSDAAGRHRASVLDRTYRAEYASELAATGGCRLGLNAARILVSMAREDALPVRVGKVFFAQGRKQALAIPGGWILLQEDCGRTRLNAPACKKQTGENPSGKT